MQFRKKERKKDRKTEKNYFRVLNNFLGFRNASFFSLFSFFLSFLFVISLPPFIREGACTVDGERQRSTQSAKAAFRERKRENTKREIFLRFFFSFCRRASFILFIKSIYISQKCLRVIINPPHRWRDNRASRRPLRVAETSIDPHRLKYQKRPREEEGDKKETTTLILS